jgi:hypothetical protein
VRSLTLLIVLLGSACALSPPAVEEPHASPPSATVTLVQVTLRNLPGQTRGGAFDYLIKALAEYTDLRGQDGGVVALDDPALRALPWILVPPALGTSVGARDLTSAERSNLGQVLTGRGLLVSRQSGRVESLRGGLFDVYRDALTTQGLYEGTDWRFAWLDEEHPVFHGRFDFTPDSDIGLLVGDRLAALMTRLPLLTDRAWIGSGSSAVDGTRFLQFTVNTVEYAVRR